MHALAVQKDLEAKQEEALESKRLLAQYRATIYQDVTRDVGKQSFFDFSLSSNILRDDIDTLYLELSKLFPGCLKIKTYDGFREYNGGSNGWKTFRIQI